MVLGSVFQAAGWVTVDILLVIYCYITNYPQSLGFPGGSAGKESACNAGDLGSIPGLGRPLEKGTATHSSILAWRIPWTSPWGRKESDKTE